MDKAWEKTTISSPLSTAILFVLLLVPGKIFAQAVEGENKSQISSETGSLETEQDYRVEIEPSIPSQLTQGTENKLILEKQDDISLQEGIEDAFAKDNGDKFQPKNKEQIGTNS